MIDFMLGNIILLCGLIAGGVGITLIKIVVEDYMDGSERLGYALLNISFGIIAINFGAFLLIGAYYAYTGALLQ